MCVSYDYFVPLLFPQGAASGSFDVETAIRVCRQGGYHLEALSLAKRHQQHNWFIKILCELCLSYFAAERLEAFHP